MDQPQGLMPRSPERRQAHRRAGDAALHYAREAMLAAGLAVAEAQFSIMRAGRAATESQRRAVTDASASLRAAALSYRQAEQGAEASAAVNADARARAFDPRQSAEGS